MSFKLIAAIAIISLLVTGTALALTNSWGILDFLTNRRSGVEVLPEAADLVQTDLPQEGGDSALVAFSVREAIYDGENIYIVVEAAPARAEYLLLGSDAYPSDPIGCMGPLFEGQGGTIGDYIAQNNKTPVHTNVGLKGMNCSIDFLLKEDGTLIYMISAGHTAQDPQLPLELTCITAPFADGILQQEAMQRNTLTVTLQNSGTQKTVASVNTAEYSDCGVRVDKITLKQSPMAIYAQIEYTVIDADKFAAARDGLWFEFVDENGVRLPGGASLGTGISPADESGMRYVQSSTIQAAETLPGEIILRGYDCWDKDRYEAHAFEMK